jgi:hypothetical protein
MAKALFHMGLASRLGSSVRAGCRTATVALSAKEPRLNYLSLMFLFDGPHWASFAL